MRCTRQSDLKDVVNRIERTVRNPNLVRDMVQRVMRFVQTKNPADDLTPQEQRMVYGPVDFGDKLPLTKKKDIDVSWMDHAEFRAELRDVDPSKVNEKVRERALQKLNPPQKKKVNYKEPGIGTFVVDMDTRGADAEADVITVWAKSRERKAVNVSKELKSIARDLVFASAVREAIEAPQYEQGEIKTPGSDAVLDDSGEERVLGDTNDSYRLVSADEMEEYCHECADKIRAGKVVVTAAELAEWIK